MPIRDEYIVRFQPEIISSYICYHAPRLLSDQYPSSGVPGFKVVLPESIYLSARNMTNIYRGKHGIQIFYKNILKLD